MSTPREHLKAALTGESNLGSEMIPVETVDEIIGLVRYNSWARQMLRTIDMKTETVKVPKISSSITFYESTKSDIDGVDDTVQGTTEVQFDIFTMLANVPIKRRALAYAVPSFAGDLKTDIAEELAYQEENVIINGDTTAGAGNVNGTLTAPDVRLSTAGLRYKALNNNLTVVDAGGSGLTLSHIRDVFAQMGKYAKKRSDLVMLVSQTVGPRMLGWDELETVDKYGPNATIHNGELGKVYGMRVIETDLINETQGATGLGTSGALTSAIIFNKNYPRIGVPTKVERRFAIELEVEPTKDLVTLAPLEDMAFNMMHDDGVCMVYNIAPGST
jgi:hypothetical protein